MAMISLRNLLLVTAAACTFAACNRTPPASTMGTPGPLENQGAKPENPAGGTVGGASGGFPAERSDSYRQEHPVQSSAAGTRPQTGVVDGNPPSEGPKPAQ